MRKPIKNMTILLVVFACSPMTNGQSISLEAQTTPPAANVLRGYCAEGDLKKVYPSHTHCDVKLGLPKAVAASILSAQDRTFLDGVSRLYYEPGLMAQRRLAISLVGAEVEKTSFFPIKLADGTSQRGRNDVFKGVGIFKPFSYWVSHYQYMIYPYDRDKTDYRWISSISISIDHSAICIPSRAAEGYLDIPLGTVLFGVVDGEKPRERWHRHEPGGTAIAEPLSSLHPQLKLGFINKCLAGVYLESKFNINEISDVNIHN